MPSMKWIRERANAFLDCIARAMHERAERIDALLEKARGDAER